MCYSQIDEIWEIPDISSPSQKFDSLAASKSLYGLLRWMVSSALVAAADRIFTSVLVKLGDMDRITFSSIEK